ncbi:poly(3-hydroxyalkanoate) depolymerase [Palleronia caenipelagi]|uniref:Poly(3-hydroxyalkanoate) depolymerase n=1 Tax=Palleronia caenipelagi TaxID=2489174 RepID=A0A547Q2S3_9RHOB|nr:poly(3-hydroxyalkanoate) depolymerase [Palleronia caenipelagi]TRD20695.1 poly(3-hydroxyalkanoate) depolymerase [Palleronia caenipelagi]
MAQEDIRMITIGAQDLRVGLFGPEDASRNLLIFNGIGASLDTVKGFADCFDDVRVITFDVPGVGGSPAPLLPYRFTWLSRLIARMLDYLGIDEVDVAGVSWGGAAAQQFVRDHQSRVRTLTLAATAAGFVMVPGNISVLSKMATPKRYTDPAHMLNIAPDIYGGELRFNQELLHEHTEAMKASTQRGYLYQLMAGAGWTSWLFLPQIKVPTLILMGEDDPIVPPVNGKIMASRLPDAELKMMNCGHLFILTDPQGTADLMQDFMRDRAPLAA